ncbi:MAG TPA: dihydroorotate dehydrogenase-like protein [Phycisphaerae bacterium]|nr:dihydroorotate dehydrogenase-like protein [Phycisphaerae bacterium]HRR86192.1 dihydroorotate dehydrogenase-like protein [Phycisphaerae bacterium]
MDLATTYLGFKMANPFMPGASPMSDNLDTVRELEDAGASAIVMRSLFEEQLAAEGMTAYQSMDGPAESFAEALTYFPTPDNYVLGPDEYLEQIRKIKQAVGIPVIASLNGSTPGGWLSYARQMAEAGADAIELHVFQVPTDPDEPSGARFAATIDMVKSVKQAVKVPVAVKLSPFYSSFANVARELEKVGADGLVLFNRFYQPDIDVDNLEVIQHLTLSTSAELPLRLRWLAILSGRVSPSLAVTGGVHTPLDAIKAVMCGAHAVQIVSALLQNGPQYIRTMIRKVSAWLEEHDYASLRQMQGSMSLQKCPDPQAFIRGNYMKLLQTWRGWNG